MYHWYESVNGLLFVTQDAALLQVHGCVVDKHLLKQFLSMVYEHLLVLKIPCLFFCLLL